MLKNHFYSILHIREFSIVTRHSNSNKGLISKGILLGGGTLHNASLLIAKSENKVGRLQLASIAGCKTKSVEVFSVMLA